MSGTQSWWVGRIVVGLVLSLLGAALWLVSAVVSHGEDHSWTDGGPPPNYVHLSAGATYSLSIPGGVPTSRHLDVDPAALDCSATQRNAGSERLATTPESNAKALQRIATFTARLTGDVHVACNGLSEVYVDDADGTGDPGGLLLVLTTVALAIGLPLLLSGLASLPGASAVQRVDPAPEGALEFQRDGDRDVIVSRRADGLDAER